MFSITTVRPAPKIDAHEIPTTDRIRTLILLVQYYQTGTAGHVEHLVDSVDKCQ